ncbi:MAG TPA: STAS domain-containing protein [Tissierellaceae bacterium]|nr:STAS domain-containing protein [Tissierellaceae bacterium]
MSLDVEKKFSENENKWVFTPNGEIDIYTSPDFKKTILDTFEEKESDILIDCINLEYVDSTGLGALIYILKKLKEKEYQIYLSNMKPNIRKLFDITKLDKLFIIRGEVDE